MRRLTRCALLIATMWPVLLLSSWVFDANSWSLGVRSVVAEVDAGPALITRVAMSGGSSSGWPIRLFVRTDFESLRAHGTAETPSRRSCVAV